MSITTAIQRSAIAISMVSLAGASSLAIAKPAAAISLSLGSWTRIGDVTTDRQTLTTANASIEAGNLSGQAPLNAFSPRLSTAIGLTDNAALNTGLGITSAIGYQEGSAIRNSSFAASAGDSFSLNWSFSQLDSSDLGFVKVGSALFVLQGASPFTYTFPTTGTYDLAIGVVDVADFTGVSVLQISDAGSAAVPTPAVLPGLVGLGVATLRRRQAK